MRQDFFEFLPAFKLFIAGNHKPSLRSVDEARRRSLQDRCSRRTLARPRAGAEALSAATQTLRDAAGSEACAAPGQGRDEGSSDAAGRGAEATLERGGEGARSQGRPGASSGSSAARLRSGRARQPVQGEPLS
jgi:hypothetical protein